MSDKTHGGLKASSQCELIVRICSELDEWLQNEVAVSFHVISQCVSCEFKFFTGILYNIFTNLRVIF